MPSPPLKPCWIAAIPPPLKRPVRDVPIRPSCHPRQLRYIAREFRFTQAAPFADQSPRIVSFVSTVSRKQLDCTLYLPQEGTLSIFLGQVLGYPKHHDERTLFSVKTWNNRMFFHDALLSNKSRVTGTQTMPITEVCLFVCSARGYITRLTNPTILRQHHRLLFPAVSAYNASHLRSSTSCMYLLMWKIHSHETFRIGPLWKFGALVPLKLSTSKPQRSVLIHRRLLALR